VFYLVFFFSSRRRHTRFSRDWSSDVCSSDLEQSTDGPHASAPAGGSGGSGLQAVLGGARRTAARRRRGPGPVDHLLELLAHLERSEEHTSELQSRENLVCRLLLEKKRKSKPA